MAKLLPTGKKVPIQLCRERQSTGEPNLYSLCCGWVREVMAGQKESILSLTTTSQTKCSDSLGLQTSCGKSYFLISVLNPGGLTSFMIFWMDFCCSFNDCLTNHPFASVFCISQLISFPSTAWSLLHYKTSPDLDSHSCTNLFGSSLQSQSPHRSSRTGMKVFMTPCPDSFSSDFYLNIS